MSSSTVYIVTCQLQKIEESWTLRIPKLMAFHPNLSYVATTLPGRKGWREVYNRTQQVCPIRGRMTYSVKQNRPEDHTRLLLRRAGGVGSRRLYKGWGVARPEYSLCVVPLAVRRGTFFKMASALLVMVGHGSWQTFHLSWQCYGSGFVRSWKLNLHASSLNLPFPSLFLLSLFSPSTYRFFLPFHRRRINTEEKANVVAFDWGE